LEITAQTERLEKETAARDDMDGERQKMIEKLSTFRAKRQELTKEMKNYERSDPKQLERMQGEMKIAKEAVNRWTDNLFLVLQWIQDNKPGVSKEELAK
jgi:predicted  nucleic acid-binding Zn-ribbon protein